MNIRRLFARAPRPPRPPARYRLVVSAGEPPRAFPLASYPYPDAVSAYQARADYLAYQQRQGWRIVGECDGEVLIAKPQRIAGVPVLLTLLVCVTWTGETAAAPTPWVVRFSRD